MNLKSPVLVVPDALLLIVDDFVLVLIISSEAALLTFLGAPAAERFEVPYRMVSAALQFAGGIITALVAFNLMPPAVHNGSLFAVALAFFLGGTLFVDDVLIPRSVLKLPGFRKASELRLHSIKRSIHWII